MASDDDKNADNVSDAAVRWVFHEIEEVRELFDEKLAEGSEVRWEFFERIDKETAT